MLATCNRIELYADVDKFHAGVAELSRCSPSTAASTSKS